MDEMRAEYRGAASCRASSEDWKEIREEIQRVQQSRRCPSLIEVPVQQIQEQSVEVQRVIHTQERMQQHSGVRCIKLFTGA